MSYIFHIKDLSLYVHLEIFKISINKASYLNFMFFVKTMGII